MYYRTNAQMPNTPECPSTFWYACTDYTSAGLWLYTVFNSAQNVGGSVPWYWCQDPAQPDSGCIHVGRVTLHELGHASGLSRQSNGHPHQPDSATSQTTVMQLDPAKSPDARYDDVYLGQCDLFELQREYDVDTLAGALANCVDHATGTAFVGGEIDVAVTRTSPASISIPCAGTSTSITGALSLSSGSGLGRLAGNALPGRVVTVQWRPPGGTWTAYGTATTNSAGSYSRLVSYPTEGIREFRADFSDAAEVPLDGGTSLVTTVTWEDLC